VRDFPQFIWAGVWEFFRPKIFRSGDRRSVMGIFEAVIRALIYLCVVALVFFLCVWVLGQLGIALPVMVINILKVIFVLIAILVLVRLFWPIVSAQNWFPPRQ
jgi:Flp pilus assembly protein TadB